MPRYPKHQPANRIGRPAAIIEELMPCLIAVDAHVLPERAQQILEQRHRKTTYPNRVGESEEGGGMWIVSRARWPLQALVQTDAPVVEPPQPLLGRQRSLIGEVVGGPSKSIDRGNVWPHRRRQRP